MNFIKEYAIYIIAWLVVLVVGIVLMFLNNKKEVKDLSELKEKVNILKKKRKVKNITEKYLNNYCVVRGDRSGVFFGIVKSIDGPMVEMEKVRKLYYWDGAFAVEGLAEYGVTRPENCKFTVVVDSLIITDATQILLCTEKSIKSLSGVPEWKF